ncbi:MAG TPA: hypothetical protein DEU95_08335 [Chloroflexi bacterium]|nr:hypothetical protein [Chloroflexota bacterium]
MGGIGRRTPRAIWTERPIAARISLHWLGGATTVIPNSAARSREIRSAIGSRRSIDWRRITRMVVIMTEDTTMTPTANRIASAASAHGVSLPTVESAVIDVGSSSESVHLALSSPIFCPVESRMRPGIVAV